MTPPPILLLDISRLVRRYEHFGGPTGIDRVEIAYARWLMGQTQFEPIPVARGRNGLLALKMADLATVLAALGARWQADRPPGFGREHRSLGRYFAERTRARLARWTLTAGAARPQTSARPSVYLNVGHDGLDHPQNYAPLPGAKAALIHDVIPLTHPEYDTARATALHQRRIAAVGAGFDLVITNSDATAADLGAALDRPKRYKVVTAHLAPALPVPAHAAQLPPRTFVHLSTINRRKNLALLLHIWRGLAAEPNPPHLHIVGRRGNDQTALELLDRCTAIAPFVKHHGALGDQQAAQILSGAHALLTPSFAEGFGLPIVEAHALGVPVIASNVPAHKEIGGDTPTLCPLDGAAWRDTILAFANDPALIAQKRAAIHRPKSWDEHFARVAPALEAIAR